MSYDSMADMNWRLIEDAKEAMARKDWMLALSLFEQSRHICINEGWREGVHYADDMVLEIYPMVKHQMDEITREKQIKAAKDDDEINLLKTELNADGPVTIYDEDPNARRLRRMMNPVEKDDE